MQRIVGIITSIVSSGISESHKWWLHSMHYIIKWIKWFIFIMHAKLWHNATTLQPQGWMGDALLYYMGDA